MPHFPFRNHRPDWWPENEPWPPRRRFGRSPIFRRFGCLFGLVNLIGFSLFFVAIISVLRALGLLDLAVTSISWLLPVSLALIALILALIILGLFSVRRMTQPFDEMLAAAGKVAEGDYSVQVTERGFRDVRALARAFNDMASRLHNADQQRRALLADLTHELRTPLTVIQGNLEGMLDGVYPADEANLRALLDETNLLSRLMDDLRTLALAEAGSLQLKREPTDVVMLARETLSAFQAQAGAAGIQLDARFPDDFPALELDPGRIRQVLSNLLTNALRYTPAGGSVTLRGRVDGDSVLLEIQDTGAGIPPEELPHIFERFYKSTDSGGMGLGLAIARHLVEAHGGTLTAQSTPGQGTTMQIKFREAI